MFRYLLNKTLLSTKNKYDYDIRYMQQILNTDLIAFIKFMGFQSMSSHCKNVPIDVIYAARLRAIIWEDCGPCTQLVTNMALEESVNSKTVEGIINWDVSLLPNNVILVMEFSDLVLTHNPKADELRKTIRQKWGEKGLVSIVLAISSMRVYPTLKYALGFGTACTRVNVKGAQLVPSRKLKLIDGAHND
ncbi:hypothetical protein PA25_14770 [Pseudoalteromonas sp. A25]|uniref:hypothetical protein n=1 Tax=Pseudoalteromonas sp. A25 TaxID=116092 RepID=UPI0012A15D4A|nr:hypothetical protein [Pseudoalteromonas sp. A25]BBN81492.1 hypothetical protein PA25_14770 [Pseudoalteromonas sp. A25]